MLSRARTSTAARVLVALVLVALGVTACGDDGPTLTKTQFTKRAEAQCSHIPKARDALSAAQQATGAEVASHVADAAAQLRRFGSAIGDLNAPDALASSADKLADAAQKYADDLEELGKTTKAGQSFEDAQRAHPKVVQKLNELIIDIDQLTIKLDLLDCLVA